MKYLTHFGGWINDSLVTTHMSNKMIDVKVSYKPKKAT